MKNLKILPALFLLFISGCATQGADPVDVACGANEDFLRQTSSSYDLHAISNYLDEVSLEHLQCRADHGDYLAQYNLGVLYLEGIRVDQDFEKAAGLFHEAGKTTEGNSTFYWGSGNRGFLNTPDESRLTTLGFAPAQYALGLMYLTGKGIEEDPEVAEFWLQKAARLGNEDAKKLLKTLNDD